MRGTQANDLRRGATIRAARGGVFGAPAMFGEVLEPRPAPRPFDLPQHIDALSAELSTDIRSPGRLNPDRWARDAAAIRVRMRGLVLAVFVMVIAAAALTVAQVAVRDRSRYGFAAAGIVLAVTAAAVTVVTVF